MSFRPSANHKRPRWLALFTILTLLTGLAATAVLAHPSDAFAFGDFRQDDGQADDEPGQKDLTAQAARTHDGVFYSAWKWDDLSWSGKNTGDGCSLFDSGGDPANVDYAVCATIGGKTPTLQSVTVYQCSDGRVDRCTNPVLLDTSTDYCTIFNGVQGQFGGTDTLAVCDISSISADLNIAALSDASLLNTCSYPSREPNSDPSDCVVEVTIIVPTSVSTTPGGTADWSATLTDSAALNPTNATGSVVFKLWATKNTDGTCANLIWTSASRDLSATPATATAHDSDTTTAGDAGTPVDGYIVTDATDDGFAGDDAEVYYWTVDYTPTGDFAASSSPCGETTTVTPADVSP